MTSISMLLNSMENNHRDRVTSSIQTFKIKKMKTFIKKDNLYEYSKLKTIEKFVCIIIIIVSIIAMNNDRLVVGQMWLTLILILKKKVNRKSSKNVNSKLSLNIIELLLYGARYHSMNATQLLVLVQIYVCRRSLLNQFLRI